MLHTTAFKLGDTVSFTDKHLRERICHTHAHERQDVFSSMRWRTLERQRQAGSASTSKACSKVSAMRFLLALTCPSALSSI